jgi:hypothetical protein
MRIRLSKSYFFFLVLLLLFSCEKDSGIGQFDSIVVDNPNNPNKFRQITFLVNLNDAENGYLNLESIDSMKVYVNAKYWGTFTSEYNDTTNNTDKIVANISYSDNVVRYLLIAPYQLKTDNLETAGDFINYLNDRIVLTPGDYIFEIKEIKYRNLLNEVITLKTQVFADFQVLENTTSSYVGNIEIPINNN